MFRELFIVDAPARQEHPANCKNGECEEGYGKTVVAEKAQDDHPTAG